jgi:hypothetical protein
LTYCNVALRIEDRRRYNSFEEGKSVAEKAWLPLASTTEFDVLFVNVDPASKFYGTVRGATINANTEYSSFDSLEKMLEGVVHYVDKLEEERTSAIAEGSDEYEVNDALEEVEFEYANGDNEEVK